jgi:hypothetical protein
LGPPVFLWQTVNILHFLNFRGKNFFLTEICFSTTNERSFIVSINNNCVIFYSTYLDINIICVLKIKGERD